MRSFVGLFFRAMKLQLKRDIEEIDSTYLCRNIEWDFKVWHDMPLRGNDNAKHF